MSTLLVTGSSGFIGKNLSDVLYQLGFNVEHLDAEYFGDEDWGTTLFNQLNEIEPDVYGVKMIDAKRHLRKIVHSGQSVDDAIRYLQDCGEISIRKSRDANGAGSMYIVINDQSPSRSQSEESTSELS